MAKARTITIGTNTAEIRSARRCTSALPVWASSTSRPICASAVSAPTRVARTIESPAGVDRGTRDRIAGVDLDGHRFTGEQRGVDRRGSLLDDAVGGDLLTGRTTNRSPTTSWSTAILLSVAVAKHGDVLGAELEQRLQRRAGPSLRAGLEVPAGEDEHRHAGGDFQVDLRRIPCPRSGRIENPCRIDSSPASPKNKAYSDHPNAASVPTEISVSIVAAPWRRFDPRRPVERPGAPHHHRGGERERQPLPVVELQGRDHRHRDHRHRQHRGDDQPLPERRGGVLGRGICLDRGVDGWLRPVVGDGRCSRSLRSGDEVVGGDGVGEADLRLLGRVVRPRR